MKVEKQLRWKQIQINFTLLLNSLILWLVLGTGDNKLLLRCGFQGKEVSPGETQVLVFCLSKPVQITPKDFFKQTFNWIWLKVSYMIYIYFILCFFFIFYHQMICWVRGGHVLTYLWPSEDFLYFISYFIAIWFVGSRLDTFAVVWGFVWKRTRERNHLLDCTVWCLWYCSFLFATHFLF